MKKSKHDRNYISSLAKKWQAGGLSRKEETYIFNTVCGVYMPLIERQLSGANAADRDEALMYYQETVLRTLNSWNGDKAFKGYLYPCVKFIVAQYFRDVKPAVRRGETFSVPNDIIDCTDMKEYLRDE
jgi:hypothetical protein